MRDRGTFNFSGNLEVKKDAPLEARSLVGSYADLTKPETWTDEEGGVWIYDGMNVTCKDRPGKIYQLSTGADYTQEDSWILIGDTSAISNQLQDLINSKGSANGIASLDEQGVVPSAQLPSYVDDVIDVYATYDKSAEGVLSNIQLFSNQEKITPITPESGKIYIDVEGNYQFRWTGTQYATVGAPTVLGEVTGTAYDGGKGKALADWRKSLNDNLKFYSHIKDDRAWTRNATEVRLNFDCSDFGDTANVNTYNQPIPAATEDLAGVQTAADKKLFNSIPQTVVVGEGATSDANKVTVSVNRKTVNEGIYKDDNTTFDLPVASITKAGTMTAADKVKLDETLPQQIAKEIQDRKDAIEALKNSSSEASLAKEIEDRKAADQALDTKFTQAIKEEAGARAEYDQVQMQKIQEEEKARAAADTALENKLQTNINNLEKKHDDFVATKGKANGFASLDGNGLVPSSQLPSYVGDVIEAYATYDISETGKLSNIKLYSDPDHANPITGESGKIYLNITQDEPSYQFRWSGTKFVDSNTSSLILGEVTGTAYDGGKGKSLSDTINKMSDKVVVGPTIVTSSTNNVVIKYQTHFTSTNSNSEDSHTINAATTSQAGVMSAADKQKLDTINQAKTLSSATAGQWIRFAELSDSGYNSALVTIKEGTAGATFFFKCRSNGEVTVKVMDVTPNIYLTKIRVIKQNGQSNGYLEAYVDTASSSIAANISLSININLTDITVTSEIPGGYTSEEVSLV